MTLNLLILNTKLRFQVISISPSNKTSHIFTFLLQKRLLASTFYFKRWWTFSLKRIWQWWFCWKIEYTALGNLFFEIAYTCRLKHMSNTFKFSYNWLKNIQTLTLSLCSLFSTLWLTLSLCSLFSPLWRALWGQCVL